MITVAERLRPFSDTRREFWAAFIAAALFSIESWLLGPYSWMYGYGAGLETIPTHLALLHDDRLFSSWAPFIAGGLDRFAFWGNADPLNWETVFLSFFPVWLANGLHRFAQYLIAIYFATKLCKTQLSLNSCYAMLGGLFYGCFSYFTFGEMLALPALPMFLCLMKYSRESVHGLWLPLVIGLAFSTFTTFTHSVPYFATFAFLWSVFVLRDASLRAAINLGLIIIGLTIGDLPQLLAALANAASSHRVGFMPESVNWSLDGLFYRQLRFDYFNQDSLAKRIAWDLPLPLLTGGAVLAAYLRSKHSEFKSLGMIYLRVYAVYLLLSQRWLFVSIQNALSEWVPPVGGIFMGRFFDLPASLLIACQLALLVAMLRRKIDAHKWPNCVLTTSIVCLVSFMLLEPKIFLFYRNGVDGWGQKNYEVKALANLKAAETEPFRVASVLPLQPAYAYAQGLETADGWANLYPRVYREYWLRVIEPLLSAVPGAKAIFDPTNGKPQDHYIFLGADLVNPQVGLLPGEDPKYAIQRGFDVEQRFNLNLLGHLNVKYLLSEFPLKGRGLELIHSPAHPPETAYMRDWATGLLSPASGPHGSSIRAKLANAVSDLRQSMQLKAAGKDIFIYQLQSFVPRFRFANEIRVAPDGRTVLDQLTAMAPETLYSTAILEQSDKGGLEQQRNLARGTISLIDYQADRIELTATAPGKAFLVIANTWSPYWTASVDGKKASLVRVNGVQLGLQLASGTHQIVLTYKPPYAFHFNHNSLFTQP